MDMSNHRTPRIDSLHPGSIVALKFHARSYNGPREESSFFVKITGEGNDRRATFMSKDYDGSLYEWEAYRHNGHWAYGSGGDRLSVLDVEYVMSAMSAV